MNRRSLSYFFVLPLAFLFLLPLTVLVNERAGSSPGSGTFPFLTPLLVLVLASIVLHQTVKRLQKNTAHNNKEAKPLHFSSTLQQLKLPQL